MKLLAAQIERYIPHRVPFIFVESAEVLGQYDISGICSWQADNPIFAGHFPGFPVVPGVLMVEAAAQLTGVLIAYNAEQRGLSTESSAQEQMVGVLIGIKRASFHRPVLPGSRLHFKVTLGNALGGMISANAEGYSESNDKTVRCELSVAVANKSSLVGTSDSVENRVN
jgi:3-hydroxyacyl-[acyl-carrier-protein] dehydratase